MDNDVKENTSYQKTNKETAQAASISNTANTISKKKSDSTSVPPSKDTSAQANTTDNITNLFDNFNGDKLVHGLIMSEILGSPKAKKWRGNTLWNSRF